MYVFHFWPDFPRILWRLGCTPPWLFVSLAYVAEQVIGVFFYFGRVDTKVSVLYIRVLADGVGDLDDTLFLKV